MPAEEPCRQGGANPDDWFAPAGTDRHNNAKRLCLACPLYWECQDLALEVGIPFGIFGGMDERERERVWAKRPNGRPNRFLKDMDDMLLPFLQARRDFENFDTQHASEDAA